jgi:hypothetical protein
MMRIEIDVDAFKGLYEDLTPRRFAIALGRALRRTTKQMIVESQFPTTEWAHHPEFHATAHVRVSRGEVSGEVYTDDPIYKWVDLGTLPHPIEALPPAGDMYPHKLIFLDGSKGTFVPKTTPHSLDSQPGAYSGPVVAKKRVMHPGIKARDFASIVSDHAAENLTTFIFDELEAAWQRQQRAR